MTTSRIWLPRIHRWLGLIVGIQVLLWMLSGFYFSLYPIEEIRGNHLTHSEADIFVMDADQIVSIDQVRTGARVVTLKPFLDGPIYEIQNATNRWIVDAQSGEQLSPISERLAQRMALARWAGDGQLQTLTRLDPAPAESGAEGAVWQASFEGADSADLYIEEDIGELRAVRTQKWRLFDFLWGLHIMDWQDRETFTSWWVTLFAGLSLVFAVSGIAILVGKARRGVLFR